MRALFIALIFLGSFAQAKDFGDHSCRIFIEHASNNLGGGRFIISVAVNKALIDNEIGFPQVYLQYKMNDGWMHMAPAKDKLPNPVELGGFEIYRFYTNLEQSFSPLFVVPYVTNGKDRLFDNNFAGAIDAYAFSADQFMIFNNSRCNLR